MSNNGESGSAQDILATESQPASHTYKDFQSPESAQFSLGPRIAFLEAVPKHAELEGEIAKIGSDLSAEDNWAIAFHLWNECERFWADSRTKRGFQRFLSKSQFHTFIMLKEWLHGEYQPSALIEQLYENIQAEIYPSNSAECPDDSHIMDEKFRHLTLYQKLMADLFRMEFSPPHWCATGFFVKIYVLNSCRTSAWEARTAQRISWKFASVSWNKGLDQCCSNSCSFENPLPRKDYCPWLTKDVSQSAFPRYLWHIESKRTVDTLDFPRRAKYTCISHTWGRWRKNEWALIKGVPWKVPLNTRFDIVELPNVIAGLRERFSTEYIWFDLFCIPQNNDDPQVAAITRQEISRQSAIFRNASACIAWLNYVHRWIAEYCTIGWLSANYIQLSSQVGMYDASDILKAADRGCYLPLQLTRFSRPTFGYPKWRQKIIQTRETLQNWRNSMRHQFPFYHFEPSDWFSGIWTLQEAYLCPNMILADKDWNILCDAAGAPISLEELFAFNHVVWTLCSCGTQFLGDFLIRGHGFENAPVDAYMQIHVKSNVKEKCPPGPQQLESMIKKTHLYPGTELSRVDLLLQGNGRFCTAGRRGRAEAIMSSMGVTAWYHRNSEIKDEDLVLKMYPLEFLREAASNIGPDFYLASNGSPSPWVLFHPLKARAAGTMMPFGRVRDSKYGMRSEIKRSPTVGTDENAHPSLASWEIQQDGSVRIRKVAILASSLEPPSIPNSVIASLCFWGSRWGKSQEVVLAEWMAKQGKVFDTYAICLTKSRWLSTGLILQGRRFAGRMKLVKVGYYVVSPDSEAEVIVPDSQKVDWLVI